MDIVDDAMLDNVSPNDVVLPKKPLLKRVVNKYQQREGMYDYIRKLMALPFLPARQVQQTFDHLKTKANTEQLQRLVDYIDRQWFHHSVFDVPSWCVFQQTVRTNNDVEGSKINSMNCGLFSKSYSFSPEMLA